MLRIFLLVLYLTLVQSVMVMLVVFVKIDIVLDSHPLILLHLDQRILIFPMVHKPRFLRLVFVHQALLAIALVALHLLGLVLKHLLFVVVVINLLVQLVVGIDFVLLVVLDQNLVVIIVLVMLLCLYLIEIDTRLFVHLHVHHQMLLMQSLDQQLIFLV